MRRREVVDLPVAMEPVSPIRSIVDVAEWRCCSGKEGAGRRAGSASCEEGQKQVRSNREHPRTAEV